MLSPVLTKIRPISHFLNDLTNIPFSHNSYEYFSLILTRVKCMSSRVSVLLPCDLLLKGECLMGFVKWDLQELQLTFAPPQWITDSLRPSGHFSLYFCGSCGFQNGDGTNNKNLVYYTFSRTQLYFT